MSADTVVDTEDKTETEEERWKREQEEGEEAAEENGPEEGVIEDKTPDPEPKSKKNGKHPKTAKPAKPVKPPKVKAVTPPPPPAPKIKPPPAPRQTPEYPFEGIRKDDIDRVCNHFRLAGDPTRLLVLGLVNGDYTVNEIASVGKMSQPALSHHIALLRGASLIIKNRVGKENKYSLSKSGRVLLKAVKILVAAYSSNDDEDDNE